MSAFTYTAYPLADLDKIEGPKKVVHLIRHAQGTHNEAVAKLGGVDGGPEEEYKNWAWHDARLTDLGKEQASGLRPSLEGVKIDVVLVSPLSRTIQTALLCIPPGPPFVVEAAIRERNGTHPCDKRRPKAELAVDFPSIDLSLLETEEDNTWTVEREPMERLIGRASSFLDIVRTRPEGSIAAVTHNDFLQALLLSCPDLAVSDESLRRKFKNAECQSMVVTWTPKDNASPRDA